MVEGLRATLAPWISTNSSAAPLRLHQLERPLVQGGGGGAGSGTVRADPGSRRHLGRDGLPRDISCFRLLLPKGTLFSEEGPEIRSVVVAEVRAMEGWLPDHFELAAKAQQPAHTDFSRTLWDWDADGVKGTAARMEQLCVHALLVQLHAQHLVSEGEIPPAPAAKGFGASTKKGSAGGDSVKPPVWLGKDYQLQRQPGGAGTASGWQRGHWRALSPLAAPVATPLEWVEPVLVG